MSFIEIIVTIILVTLSVYLIVDRVCKTIETSKYGEAYKEYLKGINKDE